MSNDILIRISIKEKYYLREEFIGHNIGSVYKNNKILPLLSGVIIVIEAFVMIQKRNKVKHE